MDRALASGAKGRGFEPLQARHSFQELASSPLSILPCRAAMQNLADSVQGVYFAVIVREGYAHGDARNGSEFTCLLHFERTRDAVFLWPRSLGQFPGCGHRDSHWHYRHRFQPGISLCGVFSSRALEEFPRSNHDASLCKYRLGHIRLLIRSSRGSRASCIDYPHPEPAHPLVFVEECAPTGGGSSGLLRWSCSVWHLISALSPRLRG